MTTVTIDPRQKTSLSDNLVLLPVDAMPTPALTGPNAALLYHVGASAYLAFSTTLASSRECDACGTRVVRGFAVAFLGLLDCCRISGLWSCSMTCLQSNIVASWVES